MRVLCAGTLSVLLTLPASAALTNGDFEAGNTGWTSYAGIGVQSDNYFGMTAEQGKLRKRYPGQRCADAELLHDGRR